MQNLKINRATLGLMIAVILLFFSACGVVKKTSETVSDPFKSKKRLNLSPFAEQLSSLIGDIQFGFKTKQPIYIERFLDIPEVVEYREMFKQFRFNASKLLAYSARVITLAQSDMTGPERANALADYINELRPLEKTPMNVKFTLTPEKSEEILNDVRKQENLLKAINVAQPLADEVGRFMRAYVDELDDVQEHVAELLQQRIKAEHKDVLDYLITLKYRQADTLNQLQELHQYRSGDVNAFDKVISGDPELTAIKKKDTAVTYQDLKRIEETLTDRLALLNSQFKHLSVELEYYYKQKNELNELNESSDKTLRKAKLAILVWSRVHRMMAAGVTDPATVDVFGMMKKAVDSAL